MPAAGQAGDVDCRLPHDVAATHLVHPHRSRLDPEPGAETATGVVTVRALPTATARAALTEALRLNPRFDPLQAPEARRLLGGLR